MTQSIEMKVVQEVQYESGYVRENKDTFFARLEGRFAPSEMLKTKLAYMLAKYGHRGQERKERWDNGQKVRYFEHVRRVALILMDTPRLDSIFTPEGVQIALLHDVLEDTEDVSAEMLEMMFGRDVVLGVMAMTKRNTKTLSEKRISHASACMVASSSDRASVKTASWLPVRARSVKTSHRT